MSDGTEVLLHLLAGHADTVIGNGQCARRLIRGQMNGKIAAAQADGVVRQGLIGQLVDGIGGVGDQLAQEDLAVCIGPAGVSILPETVSFPYGSTSLFRIGTLGA